LLYFTQRESLAQTGEPMFDATFHAWMYGPVIPTIRSLYKHEISITPWLSRGVFCFIGKKHENVW